LTSTHVCRVAFIAILILALSTSASADQLQSAADKGLAIAIVVVAAVVVVAVVLIHDASQKRTVTGCVKPAENGMAIIDDTNKRVYRLSGDTADLKAGERMTLRLKKIKPQGNSSLAWQTLKIKRDLGACQP